MIKNMSTDLLEIENLSLQFCAANGPVPILGNVSTSLGKGQILGVIGESGAGKSTLGNAVIGLLGPQFKRTSGSIRFAGQPLDGISAHEEKISEGAGYRQYSRITPPRLIL